MAKAKHNANTAIVERAFSEDELRTLETAKQIIFDCQSQADGLAEKIAGQLWIIYKKELYIAEGETNMGVYANKMFGISKGTCSESINTIDRFGVQGVLQDKYKDYKFSSLMAMKSLTDEQIEAAKINPTMTREQIKSAINDLKAIEKKEDERPRLEKEMNNLIKAVSTFMPKEDLVKELSSVSPSFGSEEKMSVDELETVVELLEDMIDDRNEEVRKEKEQSSTVEQSSTFEQNTIESEGPVTQPAFPKKVIEKRQFYVNGQRKSKKQILDELWVVIEGYLNNEFEVEFK